MADKKQLFEFTYQDELGNISAYYVDPVTQEQIDDISNLDTSAIENIEIVDGYTGESKGNLGEEEGEYEEDKKNSFIPEGNRTAGTEAEQVAKATAANNYGYVSTPKGFEVMGSLPGMIGLGGKAMAGVFDANNAIAKNHAREAMGLPSQNVARQAMAEIGTKNSKGHIADVNIGNETYSVGFEAKDAAGRTTLTPNEARNRALTSAFGLTQATPAQTQANMAAFKADPYSTKTATVSSAPPGASLPGLERNAFDMATPIGNTALAASAAVGDLPGISRNAYDTQIGTAAPSRGLMDVSPSFANQVESMGTQGTLSTFDRTGLSPSAAAMADSMVNQGFGNLGVNSAHRSAAHNAAVGGARGSQHVQGNAMDLATRGMTDQQKADALNAAMVGGATGIGAYASGALHVDTRATPATWGPMGYTGSNIFAGTPEQQAAAMSMMPGWSRDNLQALKDAAGEQYLSKYGPVPATKPSELDMQQQQMTQTQEQQKPSAFDMSMLGVSPQTTASQSLPGMPNTLSTSPVSLGSIAAADWSEEDRDLAAKTLAGEIDLSKTDLSTEQGVQEAYGIMSTIDNRTAKYGSVQSVINAPDQYSTWNTKAAANTALNNFATAPDTYRGLVDSYLGNQKENNLGFTSYHATHVNPSWSSAMQNKTTIGPHEFGLLPEYSNVANTVAAQQISPGLSQAAGTAAMSSMVSPHTAFSPSNEQKDTSAVGMMGAVGQVGQDVGAATSNPSASGTSATAQGQNSSSTGGAFGGGNGSGTGATSGGAAVGGGPGGLGGWGGAFGGFGGGSSAGSSSSGSGSTGSSGTQGGTSGGGYGGSESGSRR